VAKLEPLSEDEISALVEFPFALGDTGKRLVLSWAVAKAEAEQVAFNEHEVVLEEDRHGQLNVKTCLSCHGGDPRHSWTNADWLTAVLQRIGWKEVSRG